MKVLDVCDRCGTVYVTTEIDGPEYVVDEFLSRGLDLGWCPKRCGGKVRRVKEKQSLVSRLLKLFK